MLNLVVWINLAIGVAIYAAECLATLWVYNRYGMDRNEFLKTEIKRFFTFSGFIATVIVIVLWPISLALWFKSFIQVAKLAMKDI